MVYSNIYNVNVGKLADEIAARQGLWTDSCDDDDWLYDLIEMEEFNGNFDCYIDESYIPEGND